MHELTLYCVLMCAETQGNCHMCDIPKALLDDISNSYNSKTKQAVQKQLFDTLMKGKFKGWKTRMEVKEGQQPKPKPLIKKNGKLAETRAKQAASANGMHLLVPFWADKEDVDLHSRVIFSVCLVCTFVS